MTIQSTYYVHAVSGGVAIMNGYDDVKAVGRTEKEAFTAMFEIPDSSTVSINLEALDSLLMEIKQRRKLSAIKIARADLFPNKAVLGLLEAKTFVEVLTKHILQYDEPTLGDILAQALNREISKP